MSKPYTGPTPIAFTPNDFPPAISPHAVYKRNFAGDGTPDSPYVGCWIIDGRGLRDDAQAQAWLHKHGFKARGRRWFRLDMTLGGFLRLRAWARNAVGEPQPVLPCTPGNWRLCRTSIVSDQDGDVEIAQVLTDDQVDADGNLMGRGLADGRILAAAPVMLAALQVLACDDRVPADLRDCARHAVTIANGDAKPDTVESVRKKRPASVRVSAHRPF